MQHSNLLKRLRSEPSLTRLWSRQDDTVSARDGRDRLHLLGGPGQQWKLFARQVVESSRGGGCSLTTPTVACDEASSLTIRYVAYCQERHIRSPIRGLSFQKVKHRGRGRIGNDMTLEDIVTFLIDQSVER